MTSNRPAADRPPSEDAAGIVLIRLTVFVGLLGGLARTWADPDLWGHVRFHAETANSHLDPTAAKQDKNLSDLLNDLK